MELSLKGDYHDDFSFVSKSMISVFVDSPMEYESCFVKRTSAKKFSNATHFGSIMHEVLLEGRDISDVARPYPRGCLKSNGAINPKASKEFEEECKRYSAYAIKGRDLDKIHACASAVRESILGMLIESTTEREVPVLWQDDRGIRFKCKPDFLAELDDRVIIYDLKFSSQSRPDDFWRIARRFKYWLQDAHYRIGVEQARGKPASFVFFVIEDSAPFRIGRYEYAESSIPSMRDEWMAVTDKLVECYNNGVWNDEWTIGSGTVNTLLFTPSESSGVELHWE
jgi:hypothetical protein